VPFLPPPSLLLALQAVEGRSVLWVGDKVISLTKACHEWSTGRWKKLVSTPCEYTKLETHPLKGGLALTMREDASTDQDADSQALCPHTHLNDLLG
jgi:hypothetical protein